MQTSFKQAIYGFLAWWLKGLLLLLPEDLRRKIIHIPDRITVIKRADDYCFSFYESDNRTTDEERVLKPDNELEKADLLQWLMDKKSDDTEIIALIPHDEILSKQLSLPLTSEANLHEILGFEMDRQTPFSAEQVYYDSRVVTYDHEQEKIQLELFVIPRERVDNLLREIRSLRLQITKVCITRDGDMVDNIDLLPVSERRRDNHRIDMQTQVLLAATFVLFLATLYVPVFQQQGILENLEQELDRSRAMAKEVQPLINEKESILVRNQFLTEKQQSRVYTIEILEELTKILPDDTWLNRLIIRNGEVQLHGESDTATSIIQLIENSGLLQDAQFRSPVTQNNITNKDKFHVSATLVDRTAS